MLRRALIDLADYRNPRSLGSRLRARRRRPLIELIDAIYSQKRAVKILDLGGTRYYWLAFGEAYLASSKAHVTLVNVDQSELHDLDGDPLFTAVIGDACKLSQFSNGSFDLAHSNSVIEHVGGWDRIEAFAAEIRRLAPAYYLQTPYFWFPIEPHYIARLVHWLPESWRVDDHGHAARSFAAGRFSWRGDADPTQLLIVG